MPDNPFMTAPAQQESALPDFLESVYRGSAQRGLGLIQGAMELTGADTSYPETYAASQRAVDKLRQEGVGTGAQGFIGEIIGDPLTTALGPVKLGVGLGRMAATGGALGAAEGATAGLGADERRGVEMIKRGLTGAALSPALGYGGAKIGSAADAMFTKLAPYAKQAQGIASEVLDNIRGIGQAIDDDVTIGVAALGPDDYAKAISGIGDDAIASFKKATKAGVSPRKAYLDEVFKSKGGKFSAGQLGQEPSAQRLEDAARQGLLSAKAYRLATENEEANLQAMRSWANGILDEYGLAGAAVDETSIASQLGQAVKSKAGEMKSLADVAYKTGATTQAKVPAKAFEGFSKSIRQNLVADGFDIGGMPMLQRTLGQMNKAEKLLQKASAANYKPFEVYRKRLVQAVDNAATKSEKVALARVRDAYTAQLDDIITNQLIDGGDEAARALRQAPALWKNYKQSFFGRDGKAALGKIVEGDLTDRQIAGLFGSSVFGKGDTQKVVKQIKNVLGDDSAEVGMMRGMFFNRLTRGALTDAGEIGKREFGLRLKSDWDAFKTKDSALMNELFTPSQKTAIDDFVESAFLLSNQVKSKTNPSGSAIAIMDGLMRTMSRIGAGGGLTGLAADAVKYAATASDSRRAVKAMSDGIKLLGNNSTIIADGLRKAGIVGGANITGRMQTPAVQQPSENPFMQENPFMRDIQGSQSNPFMEGGSAAFDTLAPQSALPEQIKQAEGLRYQAYNDTVGARTVGYGFNMDSGIAKKVWKQAGVQANFDDVYNGSAAISPQDAESLGRASFEVAFDDALQQFPDLMRYTPARKDVILEMSYQLGASRLADFTGFKKAVESGQWTTAARHLMKSKYAQQAPQRVRRLARELING